MTIQFTQLFDLDQDKKINKMYKKHCGKELTFGDDKIVYGLYDGKLVGYVIYYIDGTGTNVKIDWIYAIGYGKILMKKLESKLRASNIKRIYLKVSVDPNENKKSVMRRMNFYIGLQYKVFDIEYREHYGPILFMEKKLNNKVN